MFLPVAVSYPPPPPPACTCPAPPRRYAHLKQLGGAKRLPAANPVPASLAARPDSTYPKVAVQLPMFNERAVCQEVIRRACELDWPAKRLVVQVLDDSTDVVTRDLIDAAAEEWAERGVRVEVIRREHRGGYKAGALKNGMNFVGDCPYVCIFDADFQPEPSFLRRTVPYLMHDPRVGYVQARWTFTNANESMLTKVQEISLNFHVKCEQYVSSADGSFFNFNGTAGVWSRDCIRAVGGWESRTTVEDMDLSLRAYLGGYRAIFLPDVTCKNELPSSFYAYRKQQHRWSCGPMQLWCRCFRNIWTSKHVNFFEKVQIFFFFFGIRKFGTHLVTLTLFCTLVPLSVWFSGLHVPFWALVYVPLLTSVATACFTDGGFLHAIIYVLFENAMCLVRTWAVVSGLLNLPRAQEWIVTTKFGTSASGRALGSGKRVEAGSLLPSLSFNFSFNRIYAAEMIMSSFVLVSSIYGMAVLHRWDFSLFLFIQGLAFLAFGLNLVDLDAPSIGVAILEPTPKILQRTKTSPF